MKTLGGHLMLRCPKCNATMDYGRHVDPAIPNQVKTIEIICTACDDGDFHEEVWLDVLNRIVPQTAEA